MMTLMMQDNFDISDDEVDNNQSYNDNCMVMTTTLAIIKMIHSSDIGNFESCLDDDDCLITVLVMILMSRDIIIVLVMIMTMGC